MFMFNHPKQLAQTVPVPKYFRFIVLYEYQKQRDRIQAIFQIGLKNHDSGYFIKNLCT